MSAQAGGIDDDAVAALLDTLNDKAWGGAELKSARETQRSALDDCDPAWGPAFEQAVRLLPDATHVLDTGNFTVLAEHFLPARHPHSVIGTPSGRFMGAGIGHALGAALARPDKPVVLWIGDGGIRSYAGELSLAAELRLSILVLCLVDGFFGSILGRARAAALDEVPLVMGGRRPSVSNGRLPIESIHVESLKQLPEAIGHWARDPQFAIMEIPLNPERYIRTTATFR